MANLSSMKGLLPNKMIQVIFLLALYVVIIGDLFLYFRIQDLISANANVVHTHQVIERVNSALLSLIDGERVEEAYINSNNPTYLEDFKKALQRTSSEINQVKLFTRNNPIQQKMLSQLQPLMDTTMALLQDAIKVYQESGSEAAMKLVLSNKDEGQIDKIKRIVRVVSNEEFFLLQEKNFRVVRDSRQTTFLVVVVGSLSNLLLLFSFFLLNHQENRYLEEQVKINKELEEKNRRIQEASRLKSEFLANMSHELRTPLNAIIGFSEFLHDGQAGEITQEQKGFLHNVLTSGHDLLRLINDVLDLSKIESGKMEFKIESVNLPILIRDMIEVIQGMLTKKQINLVTKIDPDVEVVYIDPSRFRQVLYNYLSNAIKFTPELGSVQIRIRSESPTLFRLEVEDNGIGIKPEEMKQLFVEFQQLDASTAKKYQGTGLGLALTKRIVEAQDGQVGVVSSPGKGSIFYAIIPKDQRKKVVENNL